MPRWFVPLMAALVCIAQPARAWPVSDAAPVPAEQRALYGKLLQRLSPANLAKTHALSARVETESKTRSDDLESLAVANVKSAFPNSSNQDIEAIAFIVLMEATQDMDKDLKLIMDEVKAHNKAKAQQRERLRNSEHLVADAKIAHADLKGGLERHERAV